MKTKNLEGKNDFTITSGPNKGKRWSPDTPGPTNPDYKEIDGDIPSPPDGATAPPKGWTQKSNTKGKKVNEVSKKKGDGNLANNAKPYDKVTKGDVIAGRLGKDEMGGKKKTKKVMEKNDDLPFDGGVEVKGPHKDKFGNIIKTKNMAKHLAKKGRAQAEKEAKKKVKEALDLMREAKKLISESKREEIARAVFETNDEYDDESGMAQNQVHTICRAADELKDVIHDGDNLPEWVQSKLAVAKEHLVTVLEYMKSEQETNELEIGHDDDYMTSLREQLEKFKK